MKSSVLFWNCQISQRATIPGQYFWGLFMRPFFTNSFWEAFLQTSPPLPPFVPVAGLVMTQAISPPPLFSLPPLFFYAAHWLGKSTWCLCLCLRLLPLPCSWHYLCSCYFWNGKAPIQRLWWAVGGCKWSFSLGSNKEFSSCGLTIA